VKKIYLIQPTYRDRDGRLLKGQRLFLHSLAISALSGAVPSDWQKEFCLEYFDEVNLEADASVIAISCMVCDIFHAIELAEEFRKRGKTVIIGGCAAKLWYGVVRASADSIVFGNPGLVEMKALLADAEAQRLRPEYHFGMDVDFPFDYSPLANRPISFMPVLGSVGCRNRCEFCATATMLRGAYHLRSVDAVMADLHEARKVTRRIAFVDTNFTNSRDHVLAICERMTKEKLDLFWGAESTIAVGDDPEVLAALQRTGCRMLFIGIESVNEAGLSDLRKPNVVRRFLQQLKNIREAGILVAGFFIVGLDGDDRGCVDELFDFIRDTGIAVPMVNILTPIPGTDLYNRLKREGRMLMVRDEEFLQQNLVYNTPMYRCYFRPNPMEPREAEMACLGLRERLFSIPEILRRAVKTDPITTFFLLTMNWSLRRETLAIGKALRGKHALHRSEAAGLDRATS
jgi:radical SAM superfamily enzyme YgiQ (UPF0313 family)